MMRPEPILAWAEGFASALFAFDTLVVWRRAVTSAHHVVAAD